jgi:hypothetical protein
MRKRSLLSVALALIGLTAASSATATAKESAARGVLARNVLITDQVVELSADLDGKSFRVVFVDMQNNKGAVDFVSRAGRHAYDPRVDSAWGGELAVVAVQGLPTAAQGSTRLKHPTLADEIDLFLAPEVITASSPNALRSTTLFGWRWNHVLLLLFPFLLWPIWRYGFRLDGESSDARPRPSRVLWAGFVCLWCLMDARSVYDRVYVMRHSDVNHHIEFMEQLYTWYDHVGRQLDGKSWTDRGNDGTFLTLVRLYALADHPFVAREASESADVEVTAQSYRLLSVVEPSVRPDPDSKAKPNSRPVGDSMR